MFVVFCMSMFYVLCEVSVIFFYVFFFKQKTAYEMRISDWSSDVCSSDLPHGGRGSRRRGGGDWRSGGAGRPGRSAGAGGAVVVARRFAGAKGAGGGAASAGASERKSTRLKSSH